MTVQEIRQSVQTKESAGTAKSTKTDAFRQLLEGLGTADTEDYAAQVSTLTDDTAKETAGKKPGEKGKKSTGKSGDPDGNIRMTDSASVSAPETPGAGEAAVENLAAAMAAGADLSEDRSKAQGDLRSTDEAPAVQGTVLTADPTGNSVPAPGESKAQAGSVSGTEIPKEETTGLIPETVSGEPESAESASDGQVSKTDKAPARAEGKEEGTEPETMKTEPEKRAESTSPGQAVKTDKEPVRAQTEEKEAPAPQVTVPAEPETAKARTYEDTLQKSDTASSGTGTDGEQKQERSDQKTPGQNSPLAYTGSAVQAQTVRTDSSLPQQTAAGTQRLVTGTKTLAQDVQELLAKTKAQMTQDSGTLEITLSPESLGKLSVKLTYEDGKASFVITATRPETLHLLARQSGDLGEIITRNTGEETLICTPPQNTGKEQDTGMDTGQQSANRQDLNDENRERNRRRQMRTESFADRMRLGML